jgi:hypothetical protein
MNTDFRQIVGGVFLLIFAYLLFNNSAAFNTIVTSGGGFVLKGITTLQGNSSALIL